jgi:hypothetical protein
VVLVQRIDSLHIFFSERELHDLYILVKVVWLASRDGDKPSLYNPAEHNLRNILLIFLCPSYRMKRRLSSDQMCADTGINTLKAGQSNAHKEVDPSEKMERDAAGFGAFDASGSGSGGRSPGLSLCCVYEGRRGI